MNETPISESKLKIGSGIAGLMLGLLICVYSVCDVPQSLYLGEGGDLGKWVLNSMFFIFGLYLVYLAATSANSLRAFRDRIELVSWTGRRKKVFYFRDVLTWDEYEINNNRHYFHVFTIYGSSGSLAIKDNEFDNYHELRRTLKSGKPKADKKIMRLALQTQANWSNTLKLVALGLCYIAFSLFLFQHNAVTLNQSDMLTISGQVSRLPYTKHETTLCIDLANHPDVHFEISGPAFEVTDTNAALRNVRPGVKDVRTGDSLVLMVEEKMFRLVSNEGTKSNGIINAYSLSDNNYTYLSFNKYTHKRFVDVFALKVLLGIGTIITLIGLAMPSPMTTKLYFK